MRPDAGRLKQIEELFDRLVALPLSQRTAALDQACGADSELRAEMESLLAHDEPVSAPLHLTARLQALAAETGPDPNLERRIGPYEIRRRLGPGGMANVYLAVQTEPVQRTVAIKLMRRGLDMDETIQRFIRERQVLAALNHPNIAPLYDAGTTDDGVPYFVMEYVEGESITAYCRQHDLGLVARLRLFQQVCAVVHFAHQNTVIHRDLKPANILVTPAGTSKLLDFGIASPASPEGMDDPSECTPAEDQFMTLEYASPEQISGETITTASDIYSLGIILYELLTGSRPYALTERTRSEAEQVVCGQRDPVRPSDRVAKLARAARLRPQRPRSLEASALPESTSFHPSARHLKGDLDNIVMTALRREPQLRYASVDQFSADIDRYLRHQPVQATPPAVLYRLGKFMHRNKPLVAVVAALVIGVLGLACGAVWALRARDVARDQAQRLQRISYAKEMASASLDQRANQLASLQQRLSETPEELRDWEWQYLHAVADDSFQTWSGHEDEVTSIEASADGRHVASGGADAVVRIWDARSGALLHVLRGHRGTVHSVAFTADGSQLVSGSADGTMKAWDIQNGTPVETFEAHAGPLVSGRVSRDGRWIAAGCADGTIRIWDTKTAGPPRTLHGFDGLFNSLSISPDGRQIAGGGAGVTGKVWDLEAGSELRTIPKWVGPVVASAFSPDGRWLAMSARSGAIRFFDTATWQESGRRVRKNIAKSICTLSFSPDSQRLACTGHDDKTLAVWSLDEGPRIVSFAGHRRAILGVAFSSDGERIFTASADGRVKVWDGRPVQTQRSLAGHGDAVQGLAFSPDGALLASVGEALYIWDIDAEIPIAHFPTHAGRISCIAYAADGSYLITGGKDGRLQIYDGASARLLRSIPAHPGLIACVALSPNGNQAISAGPEGGIKVWNPWSGQLLHALEPGGSNALVHGLALSPDGQWLAAGTESGAVCLWNRSSPANVRLLGEHVGTISSVAFSRDGRRLATGSREGGIRVWDVAAGTVTLEVNGLPAAVRCVSFTPAGRRVVSGDADGVARFWDLDTGVETMSCPQHDAALNCMAFSPDGQTLVSGGDDHLIRIKRTTPYPALAGRHRRRPGFTRQATQLVERLYGQIGDWAQVAAEVRNDVSLPDELRRRALCQFVNHAADPFAPPGGWELTVFPWSSPATSANFEAAWQAASQDAHAVRKHASSLDFSWNTQPPAEGIPRENFGLVAAATINTTDRHYHLVTVSDDGVRVWIDGRKVLENWATAVRLVNTALLDLTEGQHSIRVEYFQASGPARLRLYLYPVEISPAPGSRHAASP